jgi:hypothetical protein
MLTILTGTNRKGYRGMSVRKRNRMIRSHLPMAATDGSVVQPFVNYIIKNNARICALQQKVNEIDPRIFR